MHDDEYLTTDDVLEYLHVTRRTVYRLVKTGVLAAARVGHQYRFRRRDVETWLAANRHDLRRLSMDAVARPRVLVVDDEESIRLLVARTLASDCEADVETVGDGSSAVDKLQSGDFDLVITDLRMPGMDGLSVIRQVRRHSGVPFIVMTAHSTEANAIEALNLGVTGYLTKPFRLERMVAFVRRALCVATEVDGSPAP